MDVKSQLEQKAKEYWLHRQRLAATLPHFTLVQDPHPHAPPPNTATHRDRMIPIRVDYEAEGCKLREAFLWRPPLSSLSSSSLSSAQSSSLSSAQSAQSLSAPQKIAMLLCDDFNLDRATFAPTIQNIILEQWQDHQAFEEARRGVHFGGVKAWLVVDVLIGMVHFQDKVLADVGVEAAVLMGVGERVAEGAGLPAEFGPAISFSLLEQQYQLQRALIATGFTVDGSFVYLNGTADVELVQRLANLHASVAGGAGIGASGAQSATSGPMVFHLTAGDLEKLEQIRDREGRRKRRQTRSRRDAWALSSPPKLHRTALSYRGRSPPALDQEPDDLEHEDEVYHGRGATLMMHLQHRGGAKVAGARGAPGKRGRKRGRGRSRKS